MTVHVKQDFGRGRNFNMEQRAVIKFNTKLGKSASETFRSMQQVYGSQCLGRTAVFEWHKRFLEGRETLEDDKKSGRPILVRTPEMIEKVRDFVANDRNASLKMMEEALNISRETIRTILHFFFFFISEGKCLTHTPGLGGEPGVMWGLHSLKLLRVSLPCHS
ncbi:SETMR methyltransferase, partial [Acromyrmex charruanus]